MTHGNLTSSRPMAGRCCVFLDRTCIETQPTVSYNSRMRLACRIHDEINGGAEPCSGVRKKDQKTRAVKVGWPGLERRPLGHPGPTLPSTSQVTTRDSASTPRLRRAPPARPLFQPERIQQRVRTYGMLGIRATKASGDPCQQIRLLALGQNDIGSAAWIRTAINSGHKSFRLNCGPRYSQQRSSPCGLVAPIPPIETLYYGAISNDAG